MIVIKSEAHIQSMKKAGKITGGALKAAQNALHPGMTTGQLDKIIHDFIVSHGATPSFLGYGGFPGSACISINDQVIHGIPGKRKILDGDIVKIDVGACIDGFHGDSAATFAVGEVSEDAKKLMEVTQKCLEAGIRMARPGNRISDIGAAVQEMAESNGFSVVTMFVGHGVGKSLHEDPSVPNFRTRSRGPLIVKGMTLAIEPMINAGTEDVHILPDGWTVLTNDGKLSAHFEHSVAVLEDETIILTAR